MTACLLASCAGAAPPLALNEAATVDWVAAARPAGELEVRAVEVDGYRGGEIVAMISAPAARVAAALVDFEHADGHRAWAERHEVVERRDGLTVARWHFKGKLGIDPTVQLVFESGRDGDDHVVRFSQPEPVFGLAAFFGDYRVRADASRSALIARVFIESGLPFVGASDEDIAAGLREDVRLIRAWLGEGPQVSSEPSEEGPSTR